MRQTEGRHKNQKKERAGHLGEDETHQATGVGGCHWRHFAVRVEEPWVAPTVIREETNPRSRALDNIQSVLGYRGTELCANQELRILGVDLFPSIHARRSPLAAHTPRAGVEWLVSA